VDFSAPRTAPFLYQTVYFQRLTVSILAVFLRRAFASAVLLSELLTPFLTILH
jgi:hypothetical protein